MLQKTLAFALLFGQLGITVLAQPAAVKKLVILHTNDLHSRLNGFSPEPEYTPQTINDDLTKGGFARIATLISEEKQRNEGDVLVLDAGDFLMGTFFHMLEESTGFQLQLMKKMGYDAVTLGNHEFDFGPRVLADILYNSVNNGQTPLLVASNLAFSPKDSSDDALQNIFVRQIVKPYQIIEKNGLKIGIFGILGYNAIHDAPRARPAYFEDPIKTARKYARLLKEKEKVDLVICLSHSGVSMGKDGSWTGEDVNLAREVPEINVIISGHTHTFINKPLVVNGIPIVQAGSYGMGLGRLELTISQGKVIHSESKVINVNDSIPGKTDIQQLIISQEEIINQQILKSLHLTYNSIVTETSFPLICDEDTMLEKSNLGMLIADAVYYYVKGQVPGGADVTMFSAGMVRDNIVPGSHGQQSVEDIFRVAALGKGEDVIPGYPLARVYVTGKELKGILEILYMAPSSNKDYYIYFGGVRAAYDPHKGLLKKIVSIETGDPEKGFTPVDWSKKNAKLYALTANSYLLEFIGIIKKLSHGLVKVKLKNADGQPLHSVKEAIIDADSKTPNVQEVKEWMALLWYLQHQPDLNGNGIPDIPEFYRTGIPRLHEK